MGLGNISIWQLAIVLLIVVLIFGTKKLRVMGSDLGGALRGFRKAMNDGEAEQLTDETAESDPVQQSHDQVDTR